MVAFLAAWAPSRVSHMLQHYQIAATGLMLLSLALARSYLRRGGTGRLAALAVLAALSSLESPYQSLLMISGLAATLLIAGERDERKRAPLAASAAVAGVALAAVFYLGGSWPRPPLDFGLDESVFWAGDPASLALPSPYGMAGILSGMDPAAPWMPNAFEGVITPGAAVIGLLLVSAAKRKRLGFLAASAIFLLMALGPELKILGHHTGIPLPYRLLLELPITEGARSASRFAMLAAIFASVPAAEVLMTLPRRLGVAVGGLVVLECYMPVLPTLDARIPAFYAGIEHKAPVLEIPSSPQIRRYIFFQTADAESRPVFFKARGSMEMPASLASFALDSDISPTIIDAQAAGLGTVVYNRWMLDPVQRAHFDSLYSPLFQGHLHDSVAVWAAR